MAMRAKHHTALLLAIVGLLGACSDFEPGPASPADPSSAVSQTTEAFAPPGSIDAVFLQVNQEVPGFAGMIRGGGEPLLLLLDGRRAEAARVALAARLPGRGLNAASVAWRGVEYEWRDLATWHAAVLPMLALGDVVSVDANERLNRIVLGVLKAALPDVVWVGPIGGRMS